MCMNPYFRGTKYPANTDLTRHYGKDYRNFQETTKRKICVVKNRNNVRRRNNQAAKTAKKEAWIFKTARSNSGRRCLFFGKSGLLINNKNSSKMSGLKNEPFVGGKFVNFKDGKLISATSGTKEEYTSLTGYVVELDIKDEEFKGTEYRKIILEVKDDENNIWKLGFPLESGYGDSFCSIAQNIDFKKEITISGGIKQMDNDRTYGVVYIKQNGQNLKWALKKEDKPEGKKMRGSRQMDYSERNDFFHKLLIEEIRPAILKANEKPQQAATVAGKKKNAKEDLPF